MFWAKTKLLCRSHVSISTFETPVSRCGEIFHLRLPVLFVRLPHNRLYQQKVRDKGIFNLLVTRNFPLDTKNVPDMKS